MVMWDPFYMNEKLTETPSRSRAVLIFSLSRRYVPYTCTSTTLRIRYDHCCSWLYPSVFGSSLREVSASAQLTDINISIVIVALIQSTNTDNTVCPQLLGFPSSTCAADTRRSGISTWLRIRIRYHYHSQHSRRQGSCQLM